jgi:O-antigen/teichoic acid export membrane protein
MTAVPTIAAGEAAEVREAVTVRVASASEVPADFFAWGRLRALGVKSAWSLVDQGMTALTGFCVTFLLARWLAPEIYGAYAIAFAGYLFVSGLHNVIVLEPLSVIGPSRHAGRLNEYFRSQMAVHGVLVATCAVGVICMAVLVRLVAPTSALSGAIAGSGVALPFLLSLFLARRMGYVRQRPVTAAVGSGCCLMLALLGLYVFRHFGWVNPFSVFVLVGVASLAGSCVILRELGVGSFREARVSGESIAWTSTLRESWTYGRWLVGSTILYSVSGQVQTFLAAAFLGLGAAGILRAMLLPASVMTQVVTAAGLLVLPGFSYDFGQGLVVRMRQKAMILSGALCGSGICFSLILWVVMGRAEHLLFGGKYAGYAWLMPMLSLVPAVNGLTMGFSMALRASQRPHLDLLANAIAAPIAVASALSFIHWWGLAGAAASMVTSFAVYMGMNCWAFSATDALELKSEFASDGAAR